MDKISSEQVASLLEHHYRAAYLKALESYVAYLNTLDPRFAVDATEAMMRTQITSSTANLRFKFGGMDGTIRLDDHLRPRMAWLKTLAISYPGRISRVHYRYSVDFSYYEDHTPEKVYNAIVVLYNKRFRKLELAQEQKLETENL